jgi:Domain of unknown function (DUF4157)
MDGTGRRNRYGGQPEEVPDGEGTSGTPGRMPRTVKLAVERAAFRRAAERQALRPSMDDLATAAVEGKSAGSPVPAATRRIAESHLGADLSDVRVHDDADAQAATAGIGALAFTHGKDVFLGAGQRADDVGLMTHELTHVVQQGAAAPAVQRKVEVASADHPAEAEADAVAGRAVAQGEKSQGTIVEDGATAKPGQMTKSAAIAEVHGAIEGELAAAPPAIATQVRQQLEAQIDGLRGRDAAGVEQGLQGATGVHGARDAHAYAAAAREKVRNQIAEVLPTLPGVAAQMGPGQAVDPGVASAAGAATGEPLGGVQVHTGPQAARMVAEHDARAVAVGDHIAFAPGAYQPGTLEGDALLAHELAHVAQMRGAPAGGGGAIARDDDEAHEHDADAVAAGVVAGQHGAADGATSLIQAANNKLQWRSRLALKRCPNDSGAAARAQAQAAAAAAALQAQGVALRVELTTVVATCSWPAIRARLYPQISAPNVAAAGQRRAGAQPDLSGLGRIATVDHFAAAVKNIQAHWSDAGQTEDTRAAALFAAANVELTRATIPPLKRVDVVAMSARGSFGAQDWMLNLSQALMANNALSDGDAADLCNTTLHEARHAEQHFLAARWAAGLGESLATIQAEGGGMHIDVARVAKSRPINARSPNPTERALAERMYGSMVTDAAANDQIERDTTAAVDEIRARTTTAEGALAALNANITAATIAAATAARDALRAQVPVVEAAYRAYRAIPHEADAHEVGDTAEAAFRRIP